MRLRTWWFYTGASAALLLAALAYPNQSWQSMYLTGFFLLITVGGVAGMLKAR